MGCESDIDMEKTDLTANFAFCTQQTTDFVQTLNEFVTFLLLMQTLRNC